MFPVEPLARLSQNDALRRRRETQVKFPRTTTPFVLLVFFLAFLGNGAMAAAQAAQHYISPAGSDSNPGTQGSPWKTFAHAIPLLQPGDALNLLNGTYNGSNSGFPHINCASGAHNGTSTAPITIQALNERQAFIQGDGGEETFYMNNCSWWNIIGLHLEGADNPGTGNTYTGEVMFVNLSHHLVIRRNVLARSNRFGNVHNMMLDGVTDSLIEENEIYYVYRHGIVLYAGTGPATNNEVRRNYINARNYWNGPAGDYCGNCQDTTGVMSYGSQNNIYENNISEGIPEGHNNEPATGGPNSQNNGFYGEVSLNDHSCFRSSVHEPTAASNSRNIKWVNSVCINPTNNGLWSRSSTNTTFDHISIFGKGGTSGGVTCDQDSSGGVPPFTCSGQSTSVTGLSTGSAFILAGGTTGSIDYLASFSNSSVGASAVTHLTSGNPNFGSCFLWLPDGSPLRGAGSGGTDVGANVIFQYEGGVLTGKPLWDAATGAPLFKGAIVAGLNDAAGNSLFDIANRLNINRNGCSFPAGSNLASAPPPPTGLTATTQ